MTYLSAAIMKYDVTENPPALIAKKVSATQRVLQYFGTFSIDPVTIVRVDRGTIQLISKSDTAKYAIKMCTFFNTLRFLIMFNVSALPMIPIAIWKILAPL